jgi:hypothetical protein
MDSRAVIGHGLGWLLRGSACLLAPLGLACTVETAPEDYEIEEDEDDLEFRADGCGAQLEKRTVSQTCTYIPKPDGITAEAGTCLDDDRLECEFRSACGWIATSKTTPTCSSQSPACPAKGYDTPKYKVVYDLPSGNTTCDPDNKTAKQRAELCFDVYVNNSSNNKIDGRTIEAILNSECGELTTPDIVSDVECCVAKPPGGGSSGGDSGEGSTGGDCSSTGEWSDGSASASGDSGAEECPAGSTWQCSGGDEGPLSCTCVVEEPVPLPLPSP